MKSNKIKSFLVNFSVENFGCIKERVDFTMSANKTSKNTFSYGSDHFLKSSMFYGPNASGKTTFLNAISFMDFKINQSVNEDHNDNHDNHKAIPFLMEEGFDKKPSVFEIIFFLAGKFYRYGFSVMRNGDVLRESLVDETTKKSKLLFLRSKNIMEENNMTEDSAIWDRTRKDSLYISMASQFNVDTARDIKDFFRKKFRYLNGDTLRRKLPETAEKSSENNNFKKRVLDYLLMADFCINDFEVTDENVPDSLKKFFSEIGEEDATWRTINFLHSNYNKKKEKIGNVSIKLSEESDGTKSFFGIIGYIIDLIESGGTLFVDELDSSLHPKLCKFIVDLFNSEESNKSGAQLIFTTHDVTLLNYRDIDRDQFWFFERNKYGSSSLFPLSQFKERKGSDFQTRYLDGRYGALPIINNIF